MSSADLKIKSFFTIHYSECEKMVKQYSNLLNHSDILDIGSNVGFFSEVICKNKIQYKSIKLFEPSAEYFDYSKKLLSNYSNIDFYNFGLGNRNETKTLYKCKGTNIGWNTFLKSDPNQKEKFWQDMQFETCDIKTIDDLSFNNIDFIKIDVEGYEAYVLEGGLKTIQKFKPYILIEVGWGTNHPEWSYNYSIYQKLFSLGYREINFSDQTQDILFSPEIRMI